MRVLILSTNSDLAGAPIFVETLVQLLRNRVDFTNYFGSSGPVAKRMAESDHEVKILQGMDSRLSPLTDIKLCLELYRVVKANKPDIIHCHSSKAGMIGRIVGLATGTPVLFTIHGWSWNSLKGWRSTVALVVEAFLCRLSGAHYHLVCHALLDQGSRMIGLPKSRCRVIYNGTRDFGYANSHTRDKVTFVMPARVAYPKDHEVVVRAFNSLPDHTVLALCGSGTDSAVFIKQISEWAPESHGRILCLGPIESMDSIFHTSDVFILSSYSEALPLSIIEAMSVGLPIIASCVGGIPELVVDNQNGLLIQTHTPKAFAGAMEALLEHATRARMGNEGRKMYDRYFKDTAMSSSILEFYGDIIENRHYVGGD
jgi:glycosyltransferase involved in cell wall biosynthesis